MLQLVQLTNVDTIKTTSITEKNKDGPDINLATLGQYGVYVCECLLLTFKEDKSAIVSLIGSIYVSRQTPPKVTDGHGVVIKNPVFTDSPEPTALRGTKQRSQFVFASLLILR